MLRRVATNFREDCLLWLVCGVYILPLLIFCLVKWAYAPSDIAASHMLGYSMIRTIPYLGILLGNIPSRSSRQFIFWCLFFIQEMLYPAIFLVWQAQFAVFTCTAPAFIGVVVLTALFVVAVFLFGRETIKKHIVIFLVSLPPVMACLIGLMHMWYFMLVGIPAM